MTDAELRNERDGVTIIAAVKGRSLSEGLGSLGTKSLRIIFTKVLGINRDTIETRLDSGADITLMSEECYNFVEGFLLRGRFPIYLRDWYPR